MSYQLPMTFPCPQCQKHLRVNAPVFRCSYCGTESELHSCCQCGTPQSVLRTTGYYPCTKCQTMNALYWSAPCPWCSLPNEHVRGDARCYCTTCDAQYFVDGSPNPPKPPREPGLFGRWFGRKCPDCGRKGHVQRMGSVLVNQYLIYRTEMQQIQRYENFRLQIGDYSLVPMPVPYYHNTYRTTYLCTACNHRYDETSEEEVRA